MFQNEKLRTKDPKYAQSNEKLVTFRKYQRVFLKQQELKYIDRNFIYTNKLQNIEIYAQKMVTHKLGRYTSAVRLCCKKYRSKLQHRITRCRAQLQTRDVRRGFKTVTVNKYKWKINVQNMSAYMYM